MHAQVAHAAILTVGGIAPLPVDGLERIEVAAVPEAGLYVDDLPEAAFAHPLGDTVGSGEIGKFGGAANEKFWPLLYCFEDAVVGGLVDAKWFLAQQVLASEDDVAIDRGVQVVWQGTVDGIDALVAEQLLIVVGDDLQIGEKALKPVGGGQVDIADGYDTRRDVHVEQMSPASDGAGKLAPHQPAADDAEADLPGTHERPPFSSRASACSVSALSWTTAINARVIWIGLGCWMIFRP